MDAEETVTLTLTRAQLAAVRGALDSRIEECRWSAEGCEFMADASAVRGDASEADDLASAARWRRLAAEADSALAVVEAAA